MATDRKYQRLGTRYLPKVWGLMALVLLAGVVFWGIRQTLLPSLFPESVVVVGDPARVVLWDAKRANFTVLLLPSEVAIEATYGYGTYPLSSLFSLDRLDKRGGRLFTTSLEEGLGLPMRWYLAPRAIQTHADELSNLRSLFSGKTVLAGLVRRLDTNIPLSRLLSLAVTLPFLKVDQVSSVSLSGAFMEEQLPDGSTRKLLDRERVDFLLGNTFLDSDLRKEGISVAVYNTTSTATLGQRAGRLLARMGVLVVLVGNAEPKVDRCILSGDKASLTTKTSRFIKDYFGCETKITVTGEEAADLILSLGGDYESRFLPQPR